MNRFHAAILSAVLLTQVLFPAPAGASAMFRLWVACSDLIFVGTVTNTEDSNRQWRFSDVRVDSVLYGPLATGDTLHVQWHALSWTADFGLREDISKIPLSPPIPQLDSLHGIPAIYFLRTGENVRPAEVPPLPLRPENRSTLESRLSLVLSPLEGDLLIKRMEGEIPYPCSTDSLAVAEGKLESLAGCIQAYLRDLDSMQER